MVKFCTNTMPMITAARKASSNLGLRMNHSSLVGLRQLSVIAPLGHVFTQAAQSVQRALVSIVRGNSNIGQPGPFSLPLKQAAFALQVAQISVFALSCSMPALA